MTAGSVVGRGWGLIGRCWRPLLLLVLLLDVPPILGEVISVDGGYLTQDVAMPLWGLLGLALMPLSHGASLFLMQSAVDKRHRSILSALDGSARVWGKYQVAYLYMSFLMLGWAAVSMIPGLLLMMMLGIKQVWVLAPFAAVGLVYALLPLTFQEPYFVTLGLSPWEARENSRSLVKGYWLLILKIAGLTMLLPLAIEFGTDSALEWLGLAEGWWHGILKAAFGTAGAFLYIVPAAAYYVLFRDLVPSAKASEGASAATVPS